MNDECLMNVVVAVAWFRGDHQHDLIMRDGWIIQDLDHTKKCNNCCCCVLVYGGGGVVENVTSHSVVQKKNKKK